MWKDVHEAVDKALIQDAIGQIMNSLRDRHRSVLFCRFWLGMTLKETGAECGVSQEVIRQNEAKALRILRSERYAKEFDKLGLDWIQRIREDVEREEKNEQELRQKEAAEWHKNYIEKKIAARKLAEARKKLQIIYVEGPPPPVYVKPAPPKPPKFPPSIVKLLYNNQNAPFLYISPSYGYIDRDLDPETYDKWLAYLIQNKRESYS